MAIKKSVLSRPTQLSNTKRASIFDKTAEKVTKSYFDPAYNGTEWPRLARENRDRIVATEDPEQFELAMHDLVRSLRTSHTGFFHQSVRRVPGRLAIGASFRKVEEDGTTRRDDQQFCTMPVVPEFWQLNASTNLWGSMVGLPRRC